MVRTYSYTFAAVNAAFFYNFRLSVAHTNSLSRAAFDTVDTALTLVSVKCDGMVILFFIARGGHLQFWNGAFSAGEVITGTVCLHRYIIYGTN